MKPVSFALTALIALTLLGTACAPAASPTPAPATAAPAAATQPPATSAPVATPTGPATVMATSNAKYGMILTDDKGMTLYLFLNDTTSASTCSGACLNNWPALLTNGNPVAGTGVDGTMLGTTTRPDGSVQVTYNGHPLYYFFKDANPGDVNGEGIKNVWYVVSPSGNKVTGS